MIAPLVYLLTFGSALASLFFPFYGLLVYVCFGILRPEFFAYDVIPPGNYSRVAGVALLAGWAIHGFGIWRLGRAGTLVMLAIGYWLWTIASACAAPHQQTAWNAVLVTTKITLPILAGITLLDSIARLKLLAWVIVLSQSAVALTLIAPYLGGFNRAKDIGFGGYDNNGVALLMLTSLPIAFFLGFAERDWRRRALALGGAVLMTHCVLISGSRGGMLGLLVTVIASFFLIPRRLIYYVALCGALMVMAALSTPEIRSRFGTTFTDQSKRDESARERLQLWQDNWDVMLKNPVLGCGPDHWPLIAPQYGWREGKAGHTHWLQTGAELGFPGLMLLVMFYGLAVVRLWPLVRDGAASDPWLADAARMVMASVVGFAVAAQFITVTGFELPYFVVLLGTGVLRVSSANVGATLVSPSWQMPQGETSLAPTQQPMPNRANEPLAQP